MGQIRAFVVDDIPEVANLHERVFRGRSTPASPAKKDYFHEIFFRNPYYEEDLPSLVYEADGKIVGFHGTVCRRMTLNGQTIRVAGPTQFMVEPEYRTPFVSVSLIKAFLEGPQDLAFNDGGTEPVRKIWEGLGGTTALCLSAAAIPSRCRCKSWTWRCSLLPITDAFHRCRGRGFSTHPIRRWPLQDRCE